MKALLVASLLFGLGPQVWLPTLLAAQPPFLPPPPAPEPAAESEESPGGQAPAELGLPQEQLFTLEESLDELTRELEALEIESPLFDDDLEREAFEEMVETGQAPVLARPTGKVFPFGESVPRLVCAPDRACDVELEAGEVVDGVALGATDRWEVTQFFEGEGEALTPHILVKPSDFDLATNLVVVTNRRTYYIELASIGENDAEATFDHHVSFWYPQSWAIRIRSEREARSVPAAVEPDTEPDEASGPGPEGWHFGYRIEVPRRRSRQLPWRPRAVFDDGERMFIRLPPHARPLPALVGRDLDGTPFPLNEQLRGDRTFVIPTLVPVVELVTGSGKNRRWVTVKRLGRTP